MNKYRLLLSKIYRFFFPIDEVTKFRKMGVKIGDGCKIQSEVIIDYAHYWLVSIGNNVTLAPRVHILAHDASCKRELNYTKLGLTRIEDNVFVGAGSIILPGVNVGKGAIIGAGSVVTKDVPANMIVAGNPARIICSAQDYYEKVRSMMNSQNTFDESYTIRKNVSEEKKQEMIDAIQEYGCGFVE
ncbi:MAG: acyltransferase [Bacteroidales bacterium]|nr:acyltransferase [Bacteroidales bacterium]